MYSSDDEMDADEEVETDEEAQHETLAALAMAVDDSEDETMKESTAPDEIFEGDHDDKCDFIDEEKEEGS